MSIIRMYCGDYDRLFRSQKDNLAVCFTGHRNLPPKDIPAIRSLLRQSIEEAYHLGFRVFYCGAALGFDLLAGYEVLDLKKTYAALKLILVIPCSDQSRFWTAPDKRRWEKLIAEADQKIVKSSSYYTGCMQVRNRYMVDHSQLCICYQENFSGGTFSTVRYAQRCMVPVLNLCIPLLKEKAQYAASDPLFRESDHYGIIPSYPLLHKKMPLLRFHFVPGSDIVRSIVYCHAAFGSKAVFFRASRSYAFPRNRIYRRRNAISCGN